MVVPRRIDPGGLDRHVDHGHTHQTSLAPGEIMKLLGVYLQEFNREYLQTRADRRRTRQTITDFLVTLSAILLLAFWLYAWQN